MPFEIEYICISHPGKYRSKNEDNFVCRFDYMPASNNGTDEPVCAHVDAADSPLFGVFDGMGGEDCGEIAAYIAARNAAGITPGGEPDDVLEEFCRGANAEICQYIVDTDYRSMGTTAAMLLFDKKYIHLCNLGDSKVLYYSDDTLTQISHDHVAEAADGRKPPLLQNLGIPENELTLTPYLSIGRYYNGDQFLICSDGLTDMVSNARISEILALGGELDVTAKMLLDAALDGGGRDNITFILLKTVKKPLFAKKQKSVFAEDDNG